MLPGTLPIWVAVGHVDLHWSFDRLVGIVRSQLGGDPKAGLFVFLNRRANKAKVLFYDSTGWCVLYKRLDHGVFPRPETLDAEAAYVVVSVRELQLMLLGRNLPTHRRRPTPPPRKNDPVIH